jgi:hypothetical protein
MPGAERKRIDQANHDRKTDRTKPEWRMWGPYLSERQWGTVREDYSTDGDAWNYLPHNHSRSHAYRWGEDGIAGYCDDHQILCFCLGLWNHKDPIIKERLFGLSGPEGNHGEDVKELYYYLDGTPTNSYLKMLYKYPQSEFPYKQLLDENAAAGKHKTEVEILDTGVFNNQRYFDVFIEYAKNDIEDILIRVAIHNRGPEIAKLDVIPQLWFRNTWSWGGSQSSRPSLELSHTGHIEANEDELGTRYFYADELDGESPDYLFCENETNPAIHLNRPDEKGYFKDAFHDYVVGRQKTAVNPNQSGTKSAAHYQLSIEPGESKSICMRLSNEKLETPFGDEFQCVFEKRIDEANAFFDEIQKDIECEDKKRVQRQAFAGLNWTKQYYYYNIREWLDGDTTFPEPPEERLSGRNSDWQHLNNHDVISMPDKWEYPWYAAWDLAFHCIPIAMMDAEFAKEQLVLMTREWYMHPNGQIPAYEWAFGDVNPPVHAWATWQVYTLDKEQTGNADHAFLERVFHKLLLNFTWWVNRKDEDNRNVFQGGFLGLDNIGVFDRSKPIAGGGHLDQADGTSWMAMFSLNMLRISIELALTNPVYEDIATKFFEHFLYIAKAMNDIGGTGIGLWDEEDSFFYDLLHFPSGEVLPLKVRSLVGLTPLFAVETIEPETLERLPGFASRLEWVMENRPDLAKLVSRWREPGRGERRLLSLLRGHRMKCLLTRMLDETEFLSDYGVRALSRAHKDNPYELPTEKLQNAIQGAEHRVDYQPGESDSFMFGGNSNWRGPIWMPMNYLLIQSLYEFHDYYGDNFEIECPTGSGNQMTIKEVADELGRRLSKLFLRDETTGNRVFNRRYPQLQNDPHFRDHILFYEYFHGDNGQGLGASHQTGWTALIANLLGQI